MLGLQDREQWVLELECLKDLSPDIHYRPEYCGLFKDMGEARLFIYREGTASVIYPFLLRKVNLIPGLEGKLKQDLYDITTPYGYGGPLATPAAGEKVWSNFCRCLTEYCKGNGIITEFIRFHPLLGNHHLLRRQVVIDRVSSVVFVDLKMSDEEIWSGYERNNRKNIKNPTVKGWR